MGELYTLIVVVVLAYTIKGLTGFGPALLIVPIFSLLRGTLFALTTSAIFDALAGIVLLFVVYREISWKFCLPLMMTMGIGSFIGANLVLNIPLSTVEMIMGVFILISGIYLWIPDPLANENTVESESGFYDPTFVGGLFAGLAGGITGGLIGMSGPILVIYLKYFYSKDFFRSQLIAVFLVENIVRIFIYEKGGLFVQGQEMLLIYLLPALLIGLWIGNTLHIHINNRIFNKVVGTVLISMSFKITLF